jgi:hypothetical protein
MKRRDNIPDPVYKPSYKMKEYLTVPDPTYKSQHKLKVFTAVPDPTFKPEYKPKVYKTLLQTIMAPFRPVSSLDAGTASISMPIVSGPPEVKPIPILRKTECMPLTADEPIVELHVPEEVVPGPEPGSREWRKQQFKLTNFI